MIRTIRVFGIPVLRIETDDKPASADKGDATTSPQSVGFVRDDLPAWHKPWERP